MAEIEAMAAMAALAAIAAIVVMAAMAAMEAMAALKAMEAMEAMAASGSIIINLHLNFKKKTPYIGRNDQNIKKWLLLQTLYNSIHYHYKNSYRS